MILKPEPSSLRGSTLGTRAAEHKCLVTGACKLIDGCSLELCSTAPSVVSSGVCFNVELVELQFSDSAATSEI